jgi:hypothetical protein
METKRNTSRWAVIIFIGSSILFIQPAATTNAQTLEFDGGIGYAAVDITAWEGAEPYDWEQMTSYYGLNILFPINDVISLGGGVRHQYLFWYDTRYFYSGSPYSTITHEVTATRIAANVRFNFNRLFIDVALGPYFFDGFNDFSGTGSFGYNIKLSEKLSLPVRLSAGLILDTDASIIPITTGIGLSYRFK